MMDRFAEPEYMDDAEEARAYAETDFSAVNQAFAERLLELAGSTAEAQVLDFGCGPGDITLRIARSRPGWRITGLDFSRAMLAFARRAQARTGDAPHASWVITDAKCCPFPDARFDILCSNSILHHITGAVQFWREIRRLARPGTLIFFRDLFRPESEAAARALVEKHAGDASPLLQEEFYRSFLSAYTIEEVREQLGEAGLASLRVEQITNRHIDIFGFASG